MHIWLATLSQPMNCARLYQEGKIATPLHIFLACRTAASTPQSSWWRWAWSAGACRPSGPRGAPPAPPSTSASPRGCTRSPAEPCASPMMGRRCSRPLPTCEGLQDSLHDAWGASIQADSCEGLCRYGVLVALWHQASPLLAACAWLARHGCTCQPCSCLHDGRPVAAWLLARANTGKYIP